MAKSSGYSTKEGSGDDVMEAFVAIFALCLFLFLLGWFVAGHKMVASWTPGLYSLSKMWLWLPGSAWAEFSTPVVLDMHTRGRNFMLAPKDVGLGAWLSYMSWCLFPLTTLLSLLCVGITAKVVSIKPKPVMGVLTPIQLATRLSHRFTGTAPILHLRKILVKDQDPLWRRQLFPHEAVMNVKVNGRPMAVKGVLDRACVRDYFMGIQQERKGGVLRPVMRGDRLTSTMLGRQVVSLTSDAGKPNISFSDRMSSAGKVLYGLLAARAFGGDQGKIDYEKARDALNNSARGEKSGRANLTVAQWIYDKYRANPQARRVFAVHHWEHTALWALLVYAKRQGKCGHWEWLWLKPTSRILFYCMNTIGRLTPHTESAAAFSQYIYERRVAKRGRLPLMRSEAGGYVHVIYVDKAVNALEMEWTRWQEGIDDSDEDFWMSDAGWKLFSAMSAPPLPPPDALQADTAFDAFARARAADEEAKAASTQGGDPATRKGGSGGAGGAAGAGSNLNDFLDF